jgi:1-acyl-sn-glycerol-3-phosphate acyltransferase
MAFVALTRSLSRIFFRDIEVHGVERLPRGVPLIVVANHWNALVDAVVIAATLPIRVRFLGKHTLWKNPPVRPFLALAGVIPVYRRQDAGEEAARNVETFARSYEELARGHSIAIFPEGISHDAPSLAPLKTGAARIALEAEARYGPLGSRIVPVGLTFEPKHQFRSRVLVHVDEPIDPAAAVPRYRREGFAVVRELTDAIDAALRAVTLNYPSWQEARLIERAVDVYIRAASDAPGEAALAERFRTRAAFADGYRAVQAASPARVRTVARAVRHYDRLLRRFRLRDDHVAAHYSRRVIAGFLLRTVGALALWAPLAAVGTLLNWIPYRIPGWAANAVAHKPDLAATVKLLAGFFLFPTFWGIEAAAAHALLSPHAGLVTLILAPVSGYAALRFFERGLRLLRESRAYLLLRTRRDLARDVHAHRQRVADQVRALVAEYQAATATRGTAS